MDSLHDDKSLVVRLLQVSDDAHPADQGGHFVSVTNDGPLRQLRFEDDGGPVVVRLTGDARSDRDFLVAAIANAGGAFQPLTWKVEATDMPAIVQILAQVDVNVVHVRSMGE